MFGIIADLLSSVLTILFPIFASYKALRASNVSQLAPWLMYWVILSIFLLAESWTYFILGWFPFYSWIRLFALSYLVLPQTQGAKKIYLEHVDPFLFHHEREIEAFIGQAHDRAKTAGLQYLYQAIDLVREKVLGLPPVMASEAAEPSGPAPSFAQSLFSRFNMPSAVGAGNMAPSGADVYSLLSNALGAVASSGKSHDVQAQELSASGGLMPRDIASSSKAEQASYIGSQRDRLRVLMSAYDRELGNLGMGGGGGSSSRGIRDDPMLNDDLAYGTSYEYGGLRKNRSENSFENIDHEDLAASSSFDRDRNVSSRRSRRAGDYD